MPRRQKNPGRRKNVVGWVIPAAFAGGSLISGLLGYGIGRKYPGPAQAKLPPRQESNMHVVFNDDTSIPVVLGIQRGDPWLLVLPDATHEEALRIRMTKLATLHPQIHFALFTHRMVKPEKIPLGAWGGAEGIVNRQSLGISEFREDKWSDALTSMLDKVIGATENLGALPQGGLLQAVGIT